MFGLVSTIPVPPPPAPPEPPDHECNPRLLYYRTVLPVLFLLRLHLCNNHMNAPPPKQTAPQLKQGGAGLNLTEAQHVVLVEPQLDPAAEAQAVGRVHRIGQARPTHVHRFVVAHTVEEQVRGGGGYIHDLLRNW